MASHQFKTSMTISIAHGSETELDLLITYRVTPGTPETGRGYMADPAKYDPGSPDLVDIEGVRVSSKDVSEVLGVGILRLLQQDDTLCAAILSDWREREANAAHDADDARDRDIDDRLTERGR